MLECFPTHLVKIIQSIPVKLLRRFVWQKSHPHPRAIRLFLHWHGGVTTTSDGSSRKKAEKAETATGNSPTQHSCTVPKESADRSYHHMQTIIVVSMALAPK